MNVYFKFQNFLNINKYFKIFFLNFRKEGAACVLLQYFMYDFFKILWNGMEHCPLATQKRDLEVPCGTVGRALANRGRTKT